MSFTPTAIFSNESENKIEPVVARKQRALGISAEPSSLTTINDIYKASPSTRGVFRYKEPDSIKRLIAEIVSYRHPKAPK